VIVIVKKESIPESRKQKMKAKVRKRGIKSVRTPYFPGKMMPAGGDGF